MVEVRTIFNEKATIALNTLSLRRLAWFFIFISVFCIVVGSISRVYGTVVIGVLFYPFVLLLTKIAQKSAKKSSKLMSDYTNSYIKFDEYGITEDAEKGSEYRANVFYQYTVLHKVYETKSHFFLYITKAQAHVVPKCDIVSGTAEELRGLLISNLPLKGYKYYRIK